MENQYKPGGSFDNFQQIPLPNSTAVIVLGIASLPGLLCSGIPGLVMAIIALVLASGDKRLYLRNPDQYTPGSVSNMRTGRICAIISIWLCVFFVMVIVAILGIFGVAWFGNSYHY